MPAPEPQKTKEPKEPIGPLIGVAIILILMLVGAVYLFRMQEQLHRQNMPPYIPPGDTISTTTENSVATTTASTTALN